MKTIRSTKPSILTKLKSLKLIYYVIILLLIIGLVIGIVFIVKHFQTKSENTNTSSNKNTMLEDLFTKDSKPNTPSNISGYYNWTWSGAGSGNPTGDWNIGVLFGGEDPVTAITNNISNSYKITAPLKYLNLGGGGSDKNGWDLSSINYVNNNLQKIKANNWNGICFDIEICTPNVSFVDSFKQCFANCKLNGLNVLVTTSGVLPYSCKIGSGQGNDLVNSWINDSNIDYISPQMYGADGTTLELADLTQFINAKAKIIPTIPYAKDWDSIQNLGMKPFGYIVWIHDNKTAPANKNICGSTWSDAVNNCKSGNPKLCNTEADCAGKNCYNFPCYSDKKCGRDYTDAVKNCNKNADCPGGNKSECPNNQDCFLIPKICA
jgi:hypothetical protein